MDYSTWLWHKIVILKDDWLLDLRKTWRFWHCSNCKLNKRQLHKLVSLMKNNQFHGTKWKISQIWQGIHFVGMERDSLLSSLEKVIKYDGLSKNCDHPCLTGVLFFRSITVICLTLRKHVMRIHTSNLIGSANKLRRTTQPSTKLGGKKLTRCSQSF